MSSFDECERLYVNDPAFHNLTNVIYQMIDDCQITPYEARMAATYAAIRHQERTISRFMRFPMED